MKKNNLDKNKTISLERINKLQKKYNDAYFELRCNETKLSSLKWKYDKDKKRYVIRKNLIHSFEIYFVSIISLFIIMSLIYNISLLSLCVFSSLICISELLINLKKNISKYIDKFIYKKSSLILNNEIVELENHSYDLQHLCEILYEELINVKNNLISINEVINEKNEEFKISKNANDNFIFQGEKSSKEKVLVLR